MTKAYPAYKDSMVEWLGEVPEGWTVVAIKWLSPVLRGASPRPIDDPKYFDDDGEYCWVRIADVSASSGTLDEASQRLSELGSSLSVKLEPGALFISIAGTVGKACITQIKACIHDGFVYFPRLSLPSMFLYRIFEAGTCYAGLGKMGTQLNLNTDTIGSIRIAVPPRDEITPILAFLDRETAKIDVLVAEQRRLIDLLREKRQAVISHAVTKGLNPNAPLKPSGIEWLGDVPEGWEVKRLSLVCGFEQGKAHEPYFDDDGEFICVTARFVSTAGEKFKRCSANLTPAAVGDILMVMSDLPNGRALARAFLVDQPEVYAVNQRVCRITVKPKGDARYFAYQLNRHTTLLSEDDGFNQTHLSNASFTKLLLVVPPNDEQKQIADYLDEKTGAFDTLTATAETAIALLQERRAALISAAVTGKIDVRHLSPAATEAA